MPLRLRRSKILRALIILFCVLLILTATDMIWVQARRSITPGFDTTRIVSPTQDNGLIDYATAIEDYFSAGVTPQNNAAIPILQALGREALPAKQPTDGITSRLGMPHLPEQGDYFVPYDKYCQLHGAPIEDDPTERKVIFPPKVGVQTRQWLDAIAKPLARLAEASGRPRYFMPFDGGNRYETLVEVQIPHVLLLQQTHRAFLTRAMLRLQAGDFEGFHEDVTTVHRLARLLPQDQFLVERLRAANVLETSACEVERAAAASGTLSSAQAKKLAGELAAMGDLAPIDDAINISERYLWLDMLQFLARGSPTEAGRIINSADVEIPKIEPPQIFWLIPIPYEASMRTANHYDDGIISVLRLPTYPQRKGAFELWQIQANALQRHAILNMATPDWITSAFLLNIIGANQNYESTRMQNRLTQIALGLAAYKSDHREYPVSLAALAPGYLAAVPNDIFSEKPVIYAPTANGYVLYSVGPNMADDGGKSQKPADDIVASVP